jgi:hypothetical protein
MVNISEHNFFRPRTRAAMQPINRRTGAAERPGFARKKSSRRDHDKTLSGSPKVTMLKVTMLRCASKGRNLFRLED